MAKAKTVSAGGFDALVTRLRAPFETRPERAFPLAALALAALVLLPLIWHYGLWDPHEFAVADVAQKTAQSGDWAGVYATRPPLTIWATAVSVDLLGPSELAARLPHALFGMIAAMAVYGLGRRLRSPRAGLLSALVLISSPLFLFQARQLTTDAGGIAGTALFVLGAVGLTWPSPGKDGAGRARLDSLLVVVGLTMAFLAYGLVHALMVPGLALALAGAAAIAGKFEVAPGQDAARTRTRQLIVTVAVGAAALAVAVLLVDAWGQKPYSKLLGGTFRPGEVPPTATFDYMLNQLAFGLFPWSALAPLAVARLALVRRGNREAWGGLVMLAWALLGYAMATVWVRELDQMRYAALPAVAVAIGLMFDDLLGARGEDERRLPGARGGLPLLALFTTLAAIQLARDIGEFPEELAGVHLLGTIKFPAVLHIGRVLVALGILWGVLAGFAIGVPVPDEKSTSLWFDIPGVRWLARHALAATLGLAYVIALFLSLVYTPRLSEHFSEKNVFDAYFAHRHGEEPLGVSGIAGSGPDFYSRGKLEKLAGTPALIDFLRRDGRVFAVAPASELCALHQAAGTGGWGMHVVTTANSRYYLYSNQLTGNEQDKNPLLGKILRTPPDDLGTPIAATYRSATPGQGGEIQLIGVKMPAHVAKRATFKVTMIFKVTERPANSYTMFVHFDRGVRFQGDHQPLGGLCGTQFWQPGDYVVESFDVEAGELTSPKGEYKVFAGFFTGGSGNWKNMKVTSGNGDANDRVQIGTITLD